METITPLLPYIIAPITGVVTWVASTRVRNLAAIHKLQETINELVAKNAELYENQLKLLNENTTLKHELCEIKKMLESK